MVQALTYLFTENLKDRFYHYVGNPTPINVRFTKRKYYQRSDTASTVEVGVA